MPQSLLREGVFINGDYYEKLVESVNELEQLERDICNLPMIFAEMIKDEINANNEYKMYNGIKRLIRKYSQEKKTISAIDEFTRVLSGGASLEEIIQIAMDEAVNPTIESEIVIDKDCKFKEQ